MSKIRHPLPADHPRVQALVAVLVAQPGLTVPQIADACGWSLGRAQHVATCARRNGLVDYLRIGGTAGRWFVIADMPAQLEAQRAHRRAAKRRQAKANVESQRVRRAEKAAEDSPDVDDQMIQRRAPADAPLPFTCRAPASVFHLGAML